MNRIEGNASAKPFGFYVWADHGKVIKLFWFREEKKALNAYRSLCRSFGEEHVSGRAA